MRDTTFKFGDGSTVYFGAGTPVAFGDAVTPYTQEDVFNRLFSTLPPWFGDSPANVGIAMTGFANVAAFISTLIPEAWKQTRLDTATGAFLDIASNDFFGAVLPRKQGELDLQFAARTVRTIFKEKATFASLVDTVLSVMVGPGITIQVSEAGLTSSVPVATEDGLDVVLEDGTTTLDTEQVLRTIPAGSFPVGINFTDAAARYATDIQAFEALVVIGGVGITASNIALEDGTDLVLEDGTTTVAGEYMSTSQFQPLFDAISRVKPIGTTVWVSIS